MLNRSWTGSCAALVVLAAAASAHGIVLDLSGDLGTLNLITVGVSTPIPVNVSVTRSFSRIVPSRGLLTGDIIVSNTAGTRFDLIITNLVFQATNSPTGGTHIQLAASQIYDVLAPNQTYTAGHFVGGTWSTALGNAVFCDSRQGILGPNPVQLPSLAVANTFGASGFGVPLATATVSNSSPNFYGIFSTMDLFIDGDGFINMPNSYEAGATLVPAPASAAMLGAIGLFASRRRRV